MRIAKWGYLTCMLARVAENSEQDGYQNTSCPYLQLFIYSYIINSFQREQRSTIVKNINNIAGET